MGELSQRTEPTPTLSIPDMVRTLQNNLNGIRDKAMEYKRLAGTIRSIPKPPCNTDGGKPSEPHDLTEALQALIYRTHGIMQVLGETNARMRDTLDGK